MNIVPLSPVGETHPSYPDFHRHQYVETLILFKPKLDYEYSFELQLVNFVKLKLKSIFKNFVINLNFKSLKSEVNYNFQNL